MSELFVKRIVSPEGSVELNDGVCSVPAVWREPLCSVLYGGTDDAALIVGTPDGDIALARRNGEFHAARVDTGEPLAEYPADSAGEALFGVSGEIFRRGAEGCADELRRLNGLAEAGARECERLESAMMRSRKSARLTALSEMHGLKEQRNSAEARHDAAYKRLCKCRAAVNNSFFGEKDPELVSFEADSDISKALALKRVAERRLTSLPQTLILSAGLILALLTAWVLPEELWAWCFAAAGVLCLASVLMFLRTGRRRMDAGEAKADRNAILDKYGAASEEDIRDLADDYLRLCAELAAAAEEERRTAGELSFAERSLKAQSADTVTKLDFASGSSEAVQIAKSLSEAKALCEDTARRTERVKKYPLLCDSVPPDAGDRQIIIFKAE